MDKLYRGPVAFGFDPPDSFWTDPDVFEKFATKCMMAGEEEGDDWGVYAGLGFDLAEHRDTAGSYGQADSIEDFVEDNLDLSTCPNTTITDAYVITDEARLVIKVVSDETDIAEIKNWEFSPYETMELERIDNDGDDTYELIYKIGGFNRTYGSLYGEGKKVTKNQLFESIINA